MKSPVDYSGMIYSYQKDVYDGIRRQMTVHHYSQGVRLPVKPRTHTLIIGPTGTGKTHIANAAINESNWGCYHINCSMWIVEGARGDEHTLPNLIEWMAKEPAGRPLAVICDEVDKTQGNTDWYRNVQCEMFNLLDGRIQPGSYELNGLSGHEAERRFNNLFIIGCGAFQNLEDTPAESMGFNPESKTTRGLNELAGSLSRELVNRFSDKILRLPNLKLDDYKEIAQNIYRESDEDVRAIIKTVVNERVLSAEKNKTGARFGEVLVAEIIEKITELHQIPVWSSMIESKDLADKEVEDLWNESSE